MRGAVTAYTLATRFVGIEEAPGAVSNPAILAMLRLDQKWPSGDEVPWCSAFINAIAWLLDLPRSKSLAARSWLNVGSHVDYDKATPGFDVVVLKRGKEPQPGVEVTSGAPGHVGFFAGRAAHSPNGPRILVLGGNQDDSVSFVPFPESQVLDIRRLA